MGERLRRRIGNIQIKRNETGFTRKKYSVGEIMTSKDLALIFVKVVCYNSIMEYNLYLTTVQFIEEYNLSDLSHFLILFCSPIANDKIPEDFWQKVVEPQLIQAMEDFEAHKEHINIELFLDDYIKCLIGVAMSGQIHEEFWNASLEMIITNLDE